MLKRTIEYTNFEDESITEIFYFNLSKPELLELMVSYKEGIDNALLRMLRTDNNEELFKFFKKLILMAYGEKSDDGKRFMKNQQLSINFSQTEAYNVLFMDLLTNEDAAINFMNGLIPKDWAEQIKQDDIKKKTAELVGNVKTNQPSTAEIAAAQVVASQDEVL